MDNATFLQTITESFEAFVKTGTSRSTAKLKPLHGAIASDLASRLGSQYEIVSQGYKDDREESVAGRYIDKKVDIAIRKDGKNVAAVGVKFIMQNYAQNANNYFENMLGETANIRCAGVPYFQIFVICQPMPYFDKRGHIGKWERFTSRNLHKYHALSEDNYAVYFHTPDKTLLCVLDRPHDTELQTDRSSFLKYYKQKDYSLAYAEDQPEGFGNAVIYNDYELFVTKLYHTILSL